MRNVFTLQIINELIKLLNILLLTIEKIKCKIFTINHRLHDTFG